MQTTKDERKIKGKRGEEARGKAALRRRLKDSVRAGDWITCKGDGFFLFLANAKAIVGRKAIASLPAIPAWKATRQRAQLEVATK